MALVTFSGLPCSGKSTHVSRLRDHLLATLERPEYTGAKLKVEVLSDEALHIDRSVYNDSKTEKPARMALFTSMQRALGKDKIVLVDAPNYIKGYRYQMYCAAKEAGLRVCTVFVAAPPDKCKEWHASRDAALKYDDTTFDNLIMRFEEPNSMARWDSPLFTIVWDDAEPPYEAILKAVTEGQVQVANAGTISAPKAPTDALQLLETTTTTLVAAIVAEQANSGGAGGSLVLTSPAAGGQRLSLTMPPRNVTLPELQRLKRQFVAAHRKAMTQGAMEKGGVGWTEERVASMFVEHIQEHLNRVT
ncbi:chromatin associated protein KTI12 [Auriculariales sp. MPI-PUGE-AT-0066]|nr:chromatin associated protein KTI12 [Auriculariales sp. MPI-PUGE-AT-0066]